MRPICYRCGRKAAWWKFDGRTYYYCFHCDEDLFEVGTIMTPVKEPLLWEGDNS